MRGNLVAIYGGTELDNRTEKFVGLLAEALLAYPDVVIVTGGFDYSVDSPRAISTDRAAFRGAESFAKARGIALEKCFQTWIPEPERDRKGVVRFREGLVHVLKGKSAQARRLALVEQVDAVLTVRGKKHTALVLDMALAVDKPALPIPFTGGDSLDYWKDNRAQIIQVFGLPNELVQHLEAEPVEDPTELGRVARDLAQYVWKASYHVCLILSPFRKEADIFQDAVLNPAVKSAGFRPIRLDQTTDTGNIVEIFLSRLRRSDAVIADVTEGSANVLYELGQAHARGIEPMLISRRVLGDEVWKVLPFYLRQHRIIDCDAATKEGRDVMTTHVREFLANIRSTSSSPLARAAEPRV